MAQTVGSLLVLFAAALVPVTPLGAQQKNAEQELIQLEREWCAGQIKKDAALFTRILADDFTQIGSRGAMVTKAQFLSDLKDPTSTVTSCSQANVKVRLYGDVAVVTGLTTSAGTFKGAPFKDRQLLWTDTFISKDGRWQCVATQSTVVAAQQR